MTPKQFWEDDPSLMWSYRLSFIKRMEYQEERENYNAWLSGLYNYSAVISAICNAFSGNNDIQYMDMIDLKEIKEQAKMTEEEKAQKEREKNDKIIRENILRIKTML